MTSRLRTALLIALGALLMTLVLTLVANPHALPVPGHKRWSDMTLTAKERYVKANVAHARGALEWIRSHHAARELAGVVRDHRRLLRKARANLRAIEARLHPPHVLPGWFIALCECETQTPVLWTYNDGLYHGGPNFLLQTWYDYGGLKYAPTPEQATPWEQYLVTLTMHADVPWSQSNPACSARIGLR